MNKKLTITGILIVMTSGIFSCGTKRTSQCYPFDKDRQSCEDGSVIILPVPTSCVSFDPCAIVDDLIICQACGRDTIFIIEEPTSEDDGIVVDDEDGIICPKDGKCKKAKKDHCEDEKGKDDETKSCED